MTGKVIKADGYSMIVPNDITIDTMDFYISYNNRDIGIYGDVTTALVITRKNREEKFLILNGDHRKEYQTIKEKNGTIDDFINYFKEKQERKSKFSDNLHEKYNIEEDGRMTIVYDELEY